MNRAATELNTVQSNVTARVRALELELGVLLFQRHARGVKITPAGRVCFRFRHAYPGCSATPGPLQGMTAFRARAGSRHPGNDCGASAPVRARKLYQSLSKGPSVVTTGTTCSLIEDVVECRLEGAFVCGAGRPSGSATGECLSRRACFGDSSLNSRHRRSSLDKPI